MTIDPEAQPEVGRGDLTYTMAITAGALGGTTRVEITPNHSFGDEVGARLVFKLKLSFYRIQVLQYFINIYSLRIDQMIILESYHVMFLIRNMISMHFIPSTMASYVAILPGKDNRNTSFETV